MVNILKTIGRVLVITAISAFLYFIAYCALHPTGFLHAVGVEPRTPSTAYNFWSGFGSDLAEYGLVVSLFGNLAVLYRKHNCRESGCIRIGLHEYVDKDGARHPACKHHHPNMGSEHVFSFKKLHEEHLKEKAALHRDVDELHRHVTALTKHFGLHAGHLEPEGQ